MKEKILNLIIYIIVQICYFVCFGSILCYTFSIIGNHKLSGILYLIAWFVTATSLFLKYEEKEEKLKK